jgi:putative membrane protein
MTGRDTTSTTSGTSSYGSDNKKLGFMDRRFVTKAADDGMAELNIAQLAAQRATNPDVKSFAQKLVDDHSKVNSELMSLDSQKNVKIDKDDGKDRAYKRLSNKSGNDFDQEFVEHMIDEHEKDIKLFEKAAQDAKDSDVKNFAAKHVDHLRMHLQQAQSLRSSTMATGRDSSFSGRADSTTGTAGSSATSTDTGASATGSNTSTSGSDRSGTYSSPSSSTSGSNYGSGTSSTGGTTGSGATGSGSSGSSGSSTDRTPGK